MSVTFTLPFPPSVNNLFINGKSGRFKSQRYDTWTQEAGWEIKRQHPARIRGPVAINYEFQDNRDRRKRDLGNLEKATTDLLVTHGIIEGDDNTVLRKINLAWADDVEGVRVTIEPVTHRVPEAVKETAERA